MASSGTKTLVLALAVAVGGAALWWGWRDHQRRELRTSSTALVQDATAGLRAGLASRAAALAQLDADAQALDARLAGFERVKVGRDPALAFAAEEYALSARQILRELAREARARAAVEARIGALAQHMNHASRRTPAFHREALALKDALERAYFDYRVAADALGRELGGFAETRARVAAQVGAAPLLEEATAAGAVRRAAADAQRLAEDMQRARRMTGGR